MRRPLLKVCCISSVKEALFALDRGADFLGLVGPMPSGPGILSLEDIKTIVISIPKNAKTVLLTSDSDAVAIASTVIDLNVYALQLVRELPLSELKKIRSLLPTTIIFSVVHVIDEKSINMAKSYQDLADFILLDSGDPSNDVLGGTGDTHNWDYSKRIVKELYKPVFLAGGLHSNNIKQAIEYVNPAGVDLCSGLRTRDALDPEKLTSFVKNMS